MKRITRSSLARIAAAPARATAAERESEEALNRSTRRVKHATRVLESLMAGPQTSADLSRISHRFGARIHDLRRLGYRITTRIAGGTATYTLEGTTNGNV